MAAGAQQHGLLVHHLDQSAQGTFGEGDEIAGGKIVEGGDTLRRRT